jgi:hypothetical protein
MSASCSLAHGRLLHAARVYRNAQATRRLSGILPAWLLLAAAEHGMLGVAAVRGLSADRRDKQHMDEIAVATVGRLGPPRCADDSREADSEADRWPHIRAGWHRTRSAEQIMCDG